MLRIKLLSHSCIALCTSALLIGCGGGGNSSTSNSTTATNPQIGTSTSSSSQGSVTSTQEFKVQKNELKNIKTTDSLIINFSNSLDANSVNENISLINSATKQKIQTTNSLSSDGKTIVIKPANLDFAASYTLTIKKDLKDNSGKTLKEDLTYPFTVSNQEDTTNPEVNFPTKTTDISVDSTFVLKFTENVNIKENYINFKDKGNNPISFKGTYNPSDFTYTITPTKNLDISSTYTISLKDSIKDDAGNPLAESSYTFTTKSTTQSSQLLLDGNVKVDIKLKGKVYPTPSGSEHPSINSATITIKFNKELAVNKDRNDKHLVDNLIVKSTTDGTEPKKDISYANKTATISLKDIASDTYELEIKNTLKAKDGSKIHFTIADNNKKTFKIDKEADTKAPTLSKFIILNGQDDKGEDIKLERTNFIGDLYKQKDIIKKPTIQLVFSEAIKQSTINATNIKVQEAQTSTPVAGTTITANEFGATISFNDDLKLSTRYKVLIEDKLSDENNNKLNTNPFGKDYKTSQIIYFDTKVDTLDITAPTASLQNTSTELKKDTFGYVDNKNTNPIVIKFNERLGDFDKLRKSTNISKYIETPLGFRASFIDEQTLHIIPAFSKKFDELSPSSYTVTLKSTIKDLNNNSFEDKDFTFTTTKETIKDTSSPEISSSNILSPIAIGKDIVLNFNKELKKQTAENQENIKLLENLVENKTKELPITLAYNNKVITIKPTSPLSLGTNYTLVIKKDGIEDTLGNKFEGNKDLANADEKINFTTKKASTKVCSGTYDKVYNNKCYKVVTTLATYATAKTECAKDGALISKYNFTSTSGTDIKKATAFANALGLSEAEYWSIDDGTSGEAIILKYSFLSWQNSSAKKTESHKYICEKN